MEVKIEHIDDWKKLIELSVPWETVAGDYDDLLARYAAVPVKGFRAGKVPTSIVESTFRSQLRDDLAGVCAKRLCRKAMDENSLTPAAPLEITEVDIWKGTSMKLKVEFIALPDFRLPDYSGIVLQGNDEGERIDEISEHLLQSTQLKPHESLVEKEMLYANPDPEDDLEALRSAAEQRVKLMLILKNIAVTEGITVDERDVTDRLRELARENRTTEKELREYLGGGGMERLADSLLAEQVLGFLIG